MTTATLAPDRAALDHVEQLVALICLLAGDGTGFSDTVRLRLLRDHVNAQKATFRALRLALDCGDRPDEWGELENGLLHIEAALLALGYMAAGCLADPENEDRHFIACAIWSIRDRALAAGCDLECEV